MEDIANMIDRNIGKKNFTITVGVAYFVRVSLFCTFWIAERSK